MYLDSFSFAHFFEFFTCVGNVGNNNGGLVFGFVCWVVVVGIVGGVVGSCYDWLNLCCHWLRAQEGNWQCLRAVLMWSSSLSMLGLVWRILFWPYVPGC